MRHELFSKLLWGAAALTFIAVIFPERAAACAVCFDPRSEPRIAFATTAAFMTLMPLGIAAGTGLWLRRRFRRLDEEEAAEEHDFQGRAGEDA
ncbi:MAG: hypothetical protein ACE5GJ_04090 [Gemmatimonadota bacterium]